MMFPRRSFLSMSALGGLSGCGALAAVSTASEPLDTYTLSPLPATGTRPGGTRHLIVELPTSGGELATDRILIKPSPLQAQYLPGARWSDPTPAMIQTLLIGSLLNQGGFRLVGRVGAGLRPDYTLMTEILAFQAELTGPDLDLAQVRILLQLTLIRETDRSIAGTRRFGSTTTAPSDTTTTLVAGFDGAMRLLLAEAVAWTQGLT
jgi:cholesterol transport system auxiliary component